MWKIQTAQIWEEIYYSLTSRGLFLEKMLLRIQRHKRVTLHISAHPQREQDQTEKSSSGLDWLQKGICYGPAKLDNKLPQNVQNIRWSHKLYRENHENTQTPMRLWRINGSPNVGQKTRPYNNQQKRELAKLWTLMSQLTTEKNWKKVERKINTWTFLGNWNNYETWKWQLYQSWLVLLVHSPKDY